MSMLMAAPLLHALASPEPYSLQAALACVLPQLPPYLPEVA